MFFDLLLQALSQWQKRKTNDKKLIKIHDFLSKIIEIKIKNRHFPKKLFKFLFHQNIYPPHPKRISQRFSRFPSIYVPPSAFPS